MSNVARALHFGPHEGRALFGFYHSPTGVARRSGVVICQPLGYEGICAYPALRMLAERLAEGGYPVLRFDYDGTGDSAGSDADPGRVEAWIESVSAAARQLRAESGATEVCAFGVRMGATLAIAASARGEIEHLALFNPCTSGKAYLREMKVFRMLMEQSGEITSKPLPAEGSEESGGFLFSADTVSALKALDAAKLAANPAGARRVLVLSRVDAGSDSDQALTRAFESRGAQASLERIAGYAEMMVSPHKCVFPEDAHRALVAWLGDAPSEAPERARPPSTAQSSGIVAAGVLEEPVRFGTGDELFGVLTRPATESRDAPLVVFSNTAGNHHVGPNRLYVAFARKWAARGVPSLRIDLSGIGDSTMRPNVDDHHPFSEQHIRDARAAIAHLTAQGRRRFIMMGLCSGAFIAYHVALAEPAVVGVVMLNPQTFKWEAGMSLEVNPLKKREEAQYYKNRAFSKEAWAKLLRGGVDVRHVWKVARGRLGDIARARVASVKARLPGAASRGSDVARALDALGQRAVDVHFVFSGGDPGIDNLNGKLGAAMRQLKARPGFVIDTIEGPDHSYTPVWTQELLDEIVTAHLFSRHGLAP